MKSTRKIAEEQPSHIGASDVFDEAYYRRKYADVGDQDAFEHFMTIGGWEGRKCSDRFDAGWYLVNYDDVATSGSHPFDHYLNVGFRERRKTGLSDSVIATLRNLVSELQDIEPEIKNEGQFQFLDRTPYVIGAEKSRMRDCWKKIATSLDRPYQRIVFVRWMIHGGADLVAANVMKVIEENGGLDDALLVLTDRPERTAEDWLPSGAHVLCFSDFDADLTHDERTELVETMIYSLRPAAVLNINSAACWSAYRRKGAALRTMTKLFACLFNSRSGYAPVHLAETLPWLTKVYVDNAGFIEDVRKRLRVDAAQAGKLAVFHQPVPDAIENAARHVTTGRISGGRVLWVGRVGWDKNLELLSRIISRSPDLKFDIYGKVEDEAGEFLMRAGVQHDNLRLMGPYESVEKLPLANYDAFLFTSEWEGMPNVVIEMAAMGLPIVASKVGGVGELVTPETGWAIPDVQRAEPYIAAIREAVGNPDLVKSKTDAMRVAVRVNHNWKNMRQAFEEEPSFVLAVRE